MAKSATRIAPPPAPSPARAERLLQEAGLLVLAAVAAYLLLILVTYDRGDPGWSQDVAVPALANRGGRLGAWLADVLQYLFGHSAYLWVVLLFGYVASHFRSLVRSRTGQPAPSDRPAWIVALGFAALLISCTGLEFLRFWRFGASLPIGPGGVFGALVGDGFSHFLGFTGATLALVAMFGTGIS